MSTSGIPRQLSVKTRLPLQFDVVSSDDSLMVDDNNDNEQNPHFDVKMSIDADAGTMMSIYNNGGTFRLIATGAATGLLQLKNMQLTGIDTQGGPGIFFCDGHGKVSFIPAESDKAALVCRDGEISWIKIETCDQQ